MAGGSNGCILVIETNQEVEIVWLCRYHRVAAGRSQIGFNAWICMSALLLAGDSASLLSSDFGASP